MTRRFVVISGLPGSGKSTLGRALAQALKLPLLDKDDILERLFESKGLGDAVWRRQLSRESDLLLEAEAAASQGAVLVSHWRLPGMPLTSGTPIAWISRLPGKIVNIHCNCSAELCTSRFVCRKRHPGHLDQLRSYDEILAGIRQVGACGPTGLGVRIEVDTVHTPDLDVVLNEVKRAFAALARV